MSSVLSRWIRIERDERPWVMILGGGSFFFSAAGAVLLGVLQSFVIKRAGVGYLPHFFLIGAVSALLGSWLTLRILKRTSAAAQAAVFGTVAVLGTLLLALLQSRFEAGSGVLGLLAFAGIGALFGATAVEIAAAKLRVIAAEVWSIEQFTRLDFVLSTAVTVGLCAGGLLLAAWSGGTTPLPAFLSIPILAGCGAPFCLAALRRSGRSDATYRAEIEADRAKAWTGAWRPSELGKEPSFARFLTSLAVIIGLSAVFGRLFQFAFATVGDARFASENAFSGFVGTYLTALSIGSILLFNSLHRYLLRRFGLADNLFVPPALVGAGAVGMLLFPIFPLVVATTFIRDLFVPLQQTAFRAMLEGVSDWRRNLAWSWLDGPVAVFGGLIGSFLVAAISFFVTDGASATVSAVAAVALALMALRFVLTARLKSSYPKLLLSGLETGDFKTRTRSMEAMAEFRFLQDRRLGAVIDILRDESEPPALRITALRTLAAIRDPSTLRVISRFIAHLDPRIRRAAIQAVTAFSFMPDRLYESGFSRQALIAAVREAFGRESAPDIVNEMLEALIALRDPDVVPFLIGLLGHPSATVRHSTLRSLRTFTDPAIIDHVKPFLSDADPVLKAQAIAALWKFPWERATSLADALDALLAPYAEAEERVQGLYLIGALRLGGRRPEAVEALQSPDPKARLTAAIALLKLGDETGMRVLESALRDGSPEEAAEVERLEEHVSVPARQRGRVRELLHEHHLHYPSSLAVSEPLRARLSDVPKPALEALRRHYETASDAGELRKIDAALKTATGEAKRGRALLVDLPIAWREMAAVILGVNGWIIRDGASISEAQAGEIVVTEDAHAGDRAIILTDRADRLKPNEVTKSHFAPSELLRAAERMRKLL